MNETRRQTASAQVTLQKCWGRGAWENQASPLFMILEALGEREIKYSKT
jgi:hypothetical protein